MNYAVMTCSFWAFALVMAVASFVVATQIPAQGRTSAIPLGQAENAVRSRGLKAVDTASSAARTGTDAVPSNRDIARRRREYAAAFAVSAVILVIAIVMTFVFRNRDAAAAGIAALAAVGIAAMLQFTASKGVPMLLWPPPRLWLGTFAANFSLAVMFAAVGGTMLRPGMRRVTGAVVIAEIAWWGIPAFAGATGLTLSLARHRMDMDWLVFLGTAVGAVAAPAAGWATASLAASIAERIIPART
jgi:hypothetical protein